MYIFIDCNNILTQCRHVLRWVMCLLQLGPLLFMCTVFLACKWEGNRERERERDLEEREPNEILCKNFESVSWDSVVDLDECTPID